jgi:hypothetical protein
VPAGTELAKGDRKHRTGGIIVNAEIYECARSRDERMMHPDEASIDAVLGCDNTRDDRNVTDRIERTNCIGNRSQ